MKYFTIIIGVVLLISCGKKVPSVNNEQVAPTSTNTDTLHQEMNTAQLYSIDHNNKNKYFSYGSILGKPIDTIMGSDTVWFYYKGNLAFKEISDNHYAFYKNIKHWPKLVDLKDGTYLYLLERMMGEPEGSDIVGFRFKNEKLIKRIIMKEYDWWEIDMSKDYTTTELEKIIGNHPL